MKPIAGVPWNRYALVTELVEQAHDVSPQLGKTAVQKLMYLLDELYRVDTGYEFGLYTYGPFDSKLLSDLDYLEALGGVEVEPVEGPFGMGYAISPAPRSKAIGDKGRAHLDANRDKLSTLVTEFAHRTATELELLSTLVYVHRALGQGGSVPRGELVELVRAIKPKFTTASIDHGICELRQLGHLKTDG